MISDFLFVLSEERNAMRGLTGGAEGLFSYVRLEERVPAEHPLRAIER